MLRSFVADEQKLHNLIGLKSLSDLPEEADVENLVPAWMKDSFAHKLIQQLLSLQMTVKNKDEEMVEKSAFDVDMDDQADRTSLQPNSFEVTHSSTLTGESDEVIPLGMLLLPRVQIAAVRLLHSVFTYERYIERNRLGAEEKRIMAAVLQLRRLARKLVSEDASSVQCDQAFILKLHPLTHVMLLDVVFEDVYQ